MRTTMGSMLRFKRLTGKDVSDIDGSVDDVMAFVFCAIESTCAADKVEFNLTLDEFADSLSPEEFTAVAEIGFSSSAPEKQVAKKK